MRASARRVRRPILVVHGLSVALLLLASPAVATPAPIRFEHLDTDDGLSQMNVLAILQDEKGFMWFATQDGLNRFDGAAFTFIRGLSGPLWQAPDGGIWVGTLRSGLQRFDPADHSLEVYRHEAADPASLGGGLILALANSADGGLWLGTERGLDYFDLETRHFEHLFPRSDLPAEQVLEVLEDASGTLWLATESGILRRPRGSGRLESVDGPCAGQTPGRVSALYQTRDGALWVGGSEGLDHWDPATGQCHRFRHDPQDPGSLAAGGVASILQDRLGNLWLGMLNSGIDRWRPSLERFDHYRHDPADAASLGSDAVEALYEDRQGAIWVGTAPGGVHFFDQAAGHFELYGHDPEDQASLGSDIVLALHEGPGGALWVGTWVGGLSRRDPRTGQFEHFRHDPFDPHSLGHDRIHALHLDAAGYLWVGTRDGGLDRFDPESRRFEHFRHDGRDPNSLGHDRIHSFADGPDGSLWVGTVGGLDRWRPETRSFEHFRHDPEDPRSLGFNLVQHLFEHGEDLWISTWGGGLDRWDASTGSFEHFRHDAADPGSLAHDTVRSTLVDSAGRLWVATDGHGLDMRSPGGGSFRHFTTADGLANDVVHGVLEDQAGRLWISTNGGLSRFDPERGTWATYDAKDGLQHEEFNFGAFHRGASGRLYFGGIRGFNAFFGEDFRDDPEPPRTVLTSFEGLGLDIELDRAAPYLDSLALGHRQNAFSFEFAVLSFQRADRNRYQYHLQGFDEGWIHAGSRRFANYTNVPPGEYVLRVRGAGRDGVWSEDDSMLRLTIASPPWRTWWAYCLYALSFVSLVLGFAHWQRREVAREREINRRLREVDRMKDQFLANTSHELRTPLFGITGLAESLVDGAQDELPESVREDLTLIAASGHRLAGLVDGILDFSRLTRGRLDFRPRPVGLCALTEVVLTLLRPLVGGPVELVNAVDPDLPAAWADEERLQQILHNLIGNAIKFTSAGRVEITARRLGNQLAVTVSDTGIGIAGEHQERIFEAFEQADSSIERSFGGTGLGLAVARRLVELHGGRLSVDSAPGEGSAFTFTLPVSGGAPAVADLGTVVEAVKSPRTEARDLRGADFGVTGRESPADGVSADDSGDGARLLIVDDEPINRRVLANHLSAGGYRTTQAASGPEALRLLGEHGFDLVLLDVMMPRMSGYEVCRALREKFRVQDLPVIFLTARGLEEDRIAGFAEGANDYLTKPVAKGELLARVSTHLQLLAAYRQQQAEVKVLGGLLPICAACKRIRDDQGYWNQIESFLQSHTEASFTHGMCPSCAEDFRQDLDSVRTYSDP